MSVLPVIVAMGGINAAGRTSFHQGFKRIVLTQLAKAEQQHTLLSLATLMRLVQYNNAGYFDSQEQSINPHQLDLSLQEKVLAGTLIRQIEKNHFDVAATHEHQIMRLHASGAQTLSFTLAAKQLPTPIPPNWQVSPIGQNQVKVEVNGHLEVKHNSYRDNPIKSAGQLPTGFDPGALYASRDQPRGLQATIFATNDAIGASGLNWQNLLDKVAPDEIGTYSGSIAGQVQHEGLGGLLKSRLLGERVSSKQLALGLNSMSTDFINAYITGNVGTTMTSSGACATFLYNLRSAVTDIKAGTTRIAIVASSECAITPEIIEGFGNMGALANMAGLQKLAGEQAVDLRKSSRPFGENCGFTLGEGAQVAILMDDKLAVELGASILGSVPDVFINADGYKKSITASGIGNYITMAKSLALTKAIIGEQALKERSFIVAHGSSTPQNRVSESLIYHRLAQTYKLNNWAVCAPKAYVGHTIAAASGDQLAVALGVFEHCIMPGITTIDKVAADVYAEHLHISTRHYDCVEQDVALINSKGFGGNNASAPVLSANMTYQMLQQRYGKKVMCQHAHAHQAIQEAQQEYQQAANQGCYKLRYHFGEDMINEQDIQLNTAQIQLPKFTQAIHLPCKNPYGDMCTQA